MNGYEVIEKGATQHATSAKAPVPKHWIGRKVRVVNIDPDAERGKKSDGLSD